MCTRAYMYTLYAAYMCTLECVCVHVYVSRLRVFVWVCENFFQCRCEYSGEAEAKNENGSANEISSAIWNIHKSTRKSAILFCIFLFSTVKANAHDIERNKKSFDSGVCARLCVRVYVWKRAKMVEKLFLIFYKWWKFPEMFTFLWFSHSFTH